MVKIFICTVFFLCTGICYGQSDGVANKKNVSSERAYQVLIFLGIDCPISQDYVGAINKLNDEYSDNLSICGVIPEQISKKQLSAFEREYQVRFPLKLDRDMAIVKQYNIHVTPEVVLVDKSGAVQYRGAIDNWYYELGHHRQIITENYLKDAIASVLANQTVKIKETETVGCILTVRK